MNISKKYYHQIYNGLPLSRYQKRKYLAPFLADLNNYVAEHPDASYDELVKTFGFPDDVISGILHNSTVELTNVIYHSKRTIATILLIIALLSVIVCLLSVHLSKQKDYEIIHIESSVGTLNSDFSFPNEQSTVTTKN